MILAHRSMLFLVVIVVLTPFFCGQACQRALSESQGVNLIVGPLEQFSRTIGLKEGTIFDSARVALASNGLTIDTASDFMVGVTITSLQQIDEDLFPFRIEVHGGTSLDKAAGRENSPDVIGDIPAVKTISVPWNNESKILSTMKQLAATVAAKLRKEIIRRQSNRR